MYSSIKRKKCKCGCKKYPTLGCDGWSYSCAPKEIKLKYENRRKLQLRNRNARKNTQTKLRKDIYKNSEDKMKLELWFRYQMQVSQKVCENCGASLENLNNWGWKSSQHHVYEKGLFPSLMSHPKNHLTIGYYCSHSQIHTSVLNFSKMNIFTKAEKILLELFPLLTDEEKRKATKLYGEYINIKLINDNT